MVVGVISRVAHVKLSRLLLDGLDPVKESAQPPFHVATRQPAHTHSGQNELRVKLKEGNSECAGQHGYSVRELTTFSGKDKTVTLSFSFRATSLCCFFFYYFISTKHLHNCLFPSHVRYLFFTHTACILCIISLSYSLISLDFFSKSFHNVLIIIRKGETTLYKLIVAMTTTH